MQKPIGNKQSSRQILYNVVCLDQRVRLLALNLIPPRKVFPLVHIFSVLILHSSLCILHSFISTKLNEKSSFFNIFYVDNRLKFLYNECVKYILEHKMNLKAVFFDLDGTLLPMDQDLFIGAYLGGLVKLLAPKGYDPKAVASALWASTGAMIKNDGKRKNEEVFWDNFSQILGENIRDEEPLLRDFYANDFQKVRAVCGYTPKAREVVDRLHLAKIPLVLATSPLFPAVATESRIRWAGLVPEDFILYTTYENSSYCKPNPSYYSALLEKLGLRGDECLMVGNDVGEDMIAEKLGMRTFLITDCLINKVNDDISKYRHGGFEELSAYLEEIINE